MPKAVRRQKRTSSRTRKVENRNGFFSKINLAESYTSLILGAIVVLIVGILFISFAKVNRDGQTSSVKFAPKIEDLQNQNSSTSSTYTIRPGDDLWTISVNVYNNGYKWVEIAKLNNIQNPGVIYSGDNLRLPAKTQAEQAEAQAEIPLRPNDNMVVGGSITGAAYVIKSGDTLWDISVRAYGDGYKWPLLAKVNNIANPDLIFAGNTLTIPR